MQETRLRGVFGTKYKIFTRSLVPGTSVYDEKIFKEGRNEFREWNPKKSKLGAAILKGISQIGIMPGKTVLYLGCSTGTTCSHVSDMLGPEGTLIGVDVAPRVMREFYFLCQERKNMAPLMADAANPATYPKEVTEVDVVFQDIAQRNQVEIFDKNCKAFLKKGGFGLLSVKARSIDVTKKPKVIFKQVREELGKLYTIVDYRELDPFEKDHCLFVIKNK